MATYLTTPSGIRYPAPGAALPDYETYFASMAGDVGGRLGAGLQPGVMKATDLATPTLTINSSTGAVSITLAAADPIWVMSAAGLLTRVKFPGATAQIISPASLPTTSGRRNTYRLEIDTAGALFLTNGLANTSTGAWLGSQNNIATTVGRMGILDFAILNTAGVYSIETLKTDRRPWATGAYAQQQRNANASAGADYTLSQFQSTLDGTNLSMRMECSGVPIRMTLRGEATFAGAASQLLMCGGVDFYALPSGGHPQFSRIPGAATSLPFEFTTEYIPTGPGTHVFQPYAWNPGAATAATSIQASSGTSVEFVVEELVHSAQANNGLV